MPPAYISSLCHQFISLHYATSLYLFFLFKISIPTDWNLASNFPSPSLDEPQGNNETICNINTHYSNNTLLMCASQLYISRRYIMIIRSSLLLYNINLLFLGNPGRSCFKFPSDSPFTRFSLSLPPAHNSLHSTQSFAPPSSPPARLPEVRHKITTADVLLSALGSGFKNFFKAGTRARCL